MSQPSPDPDRPDVAEASPSGDNDRRESAAALGAGSSPAAQELIDDEHRGTRRRHRDPWAHRRGEPRLLAFLWAIYLFVATMLTFGLAVRAAPGQHESIRPAASMLLMAAAAGMVVLWPMVRLSQRRDPRPLAGAVQDLVVVQVPVQAIIWPQVMWWLAHWSVSVVLASSLMMLAWGLIVAGLLALAQLGPSGDPGRGDERLAVPMATRWMAVMALVAVLGMAPALTVRSIDPRALGDAVPRRHEPAMMFSPITAAYELTRTRAWMGVPPRITRSEWIGIGATFGVAGVIWVVAGCRGRVRTRPLPS